MQGQQVKHFQHGDGVVLTFVNNDVVHVQFADKVRMMSGDNLFNLDGRPFITPPPPPPSFDFVVESERRARKLLLSRRELMHAGIAPEIDYPAFVNHLLNTEDYELRLVANEEGLEIAQNEYISWTGESFPEDQVRLSTNRPKRQPRQWRFRFRDAQIDGTFRTYPFPVIRMGSQATSYARLCNGEVRGLYQYGWIHMEYAVEVEKLVRLGLRAR